MVRDALVVTADRAALMRLVVSVCQAEMDEGTRRCTDSLSQLHERHTAAIMSIMST